VKDRERDPSMDRLLRRALQPEPGAAATPQCVDPETLAAWADGSLSGEALAHAEQHVADCARCQAMLAAMARTVPENTIPPRWQVLTARWLVPFAAAAIVLAVWVSVDRQRPETAAVRSGPAAAAAEVRPAPEPINAPSLHSPDSDPSDTEPLAAYTGRQPISGTQEKESRDSAAKSRVVAPKEEAKPADPPGQYSDALASPPPPAPPGPAPSPRPVSEPAKPAPTLEMIQAIPTAPAAASPSVAARAAVQPGASDIISPEPAFRWRLLAPATIQRSTDGGVTWTTQAMRFAGQSLLAQGRNVATANLAAPITLTTGSAAAPDVCWIVGAGGVVLLSTDGTTWQRRPFPEPVNLTGVRAVDARTAIVTTEDGRQFSTADAGATWSKMP
jgi:hypothetical protein